MRIFVYTKKENKMSTFEEILFLDKQIENLLKERDLLINKKVSTYIKKYLPKSIRPDRIEVRTNDKEESIEIYVLITLSIKVFKNKPNPEISTELLGYYKNIFNIIKNTKDELFI